ncbi:MAG TPA: VWA domain-containing protein [Thermoanaerobaculia bacterium]|nr:VWA domain-containing protein [Thermoanaerobaculia bacterium]
MRHNLLALALAALALSAAAQQQKLVETLEVRVVNVEVIVLDKGGKPVAGLTKDDFEILEDRKPQPITNFYEVRGAEMRTNESGPAAPEPAEAPARHFLLFVDVHSLHPIARKQILGTLEKFVDDQLRPIDLASVVAWNRGLKIVAPLTTDKQAIRAAIAEVATQGSATSIRSDFARVQRECASLIQMVRTGRMPAHNGYEHCIGMAREEAARTTMLSRQLLGGVNVALATLGEVEAKKVLVLAGANLPQKPGLDLYLWANELFAPYLVGFDKPIARPHEEERAQRELIERVGRSANAYGVTLYALAAPAAVDAMSHAVPIDVAGGDSLQRQNTEAAFETLATLTGGLSGHISKMDATLSAIARDLGSYYSIGYRPSSEPKPDRALAVRPKNRAYRIRARQSYVSKSSDEQMNDRVIANIFAPSRASEWAVRVETGKPQRTGDDKFTVPIDIIIPSTLTLLPQANTLAGGYIVYVAVGTAEGGLSSMFRQPQGITIAPNEEATLRHEPLHFTATLTVRPGENLLSVGVLDQVASTAGFTRAKIVAK